MQNNDQRHDLKNVFLLVGIILLCVVILVFSDFGQNRTVVYDCRDAHWHPDIPVEVKRECSRLLYEEWKKQQDENKDDNRIYENRSRVFRT